MGRHLFENGAMAKRKRPERAQEGLIYLIRHKGSDLYKIGITLDWARRARQLEVGSKVEPIKVCRVLNPGKLEKQLHSRFSPQRLPQSEWFHLAEDQVKAVTEIFDDAAEHYKNWISRLEAPKAVPTRPPKPYRNPRLTPEAVRQVTRPSPQPHAEQTQRAATRQSFTAQPDKNRLTSEPIGIGSALIFGASASIAFPILAFIFLATFSSSAWIVGFLIQTVILAMFIYNQGKNQR